MKTYVPRYGFTALALLLSISPVKAQTGTLERPSPANPSPTTLPPRDGAVRRVTLDLRDVPVRDALARLFQLQPGVRYTLDDSVTRKPLKVSVTIKDLPFNAALNILLRSAGLRASRKQEGYTIWLRTPPVSYLPQVNLPPVPEHRLPNQVPADFDFRIEYGIGGKNVLDTFRGLFTKDLVAAPSVTVPLTLTLGERLRIYRKMAAVHLFNYPETFRIPSYADMAPQSTVTIKVRSGHRTRTLRWDGATPTPNPAQRHLLEVIELVNAIVTAKPAYKRLPAASGAYL